MVVFGKVANVVFFSPFPFPFVWPNFFPDRVDLLSSRSCSVYVKLIPFSELCLLRFAKLANLDVSPSELTFSLECKICLSATLSKLELDVCLLNLGGSSLSYPLSDKMCCTPLPYTSWTLDLAGNVGSVVLLLPMCAPTSLSGFLPKLCKLSCAGESLDHSIGSPLSLPRQTFRSHLGSAKVLYRQLRVVRNAVTPGSSASVRAPPLLFPVARPTSGVRSSYGFLVRHGA